MRYNYVRRGDQIIEIKRYSGGRIISRFSSVIHNFGGSFIPPGQYCFPFSFKTGSDYPASFMVPPLLFRTSPATTCEREGSNTRCRLSSEDSTPG